MGRRRRRGRALIDLPLWGWALAGAGFGAILGSFFATLVLRWPRDETLWGRSRCDSCRVPLGPLELMPLLSAGLANGKCRHCDTAIDRRHSWIELVCAGVGAAAMIRAPGWEGLAGTLFGATLVALAWLDAEHFWLPDRLTWPLAGAGLIAGVAGLTPALADRALGLLAGFLMLAVIAFAYRAVRKRDGLGGGDPKLFGAIGAWLGWQGLPLVLLGASVAGLAWVAARMLGGQRIAASDRVPFGAFLAAAGFAVWLWQS